MIIPVPFKSQGQDAAEQFYRTYLQNRLEYTEPKTINEMDIDNTNYIVKDTHYI